MQVKSIAERSISIFVLSIFEWPFYTDFTVVHNACFNKHQLSFAYL